MRTIDISAIEWLAHAIELFEVLTIVAGAVFATALFSLKPFPLEARQLELRIKKNRTMTIHRKCDCAQKEGFA